MEIYQNPLFFHKNIFFLIRKSLNSIFRANIRNLLLRAHTHGTYISTPPTYGTSTPLSMVFLTPYPWYIEPPYHGILTPCLSLD
jgi:hypothetical protein